MLCWNRNLNWAFWLGQSQAWGKTRILSPRHHGPSGWVEPCLALGLRRPADPRTQVKFVKYERAGNCFIYIQQESSCGMECIAAADLHTTIPGALSFTLPQTEPSSFVLTYIFSEKHQHRRVVPTPNDRSWIIPCITCVKVINFFN